ncbi:neuronal acetylcholine receptor subunit alpha-9-like [Mizuhopecten yessoensis]|uniref:neuronal acetylcholine receptor subunit alpha-9-like n=1 Tax=Mizuhopecten yessoensis TaxID=6573 RepID=UPI000B458788|nr:neuronal acetylcholine receptor subunit alpha-9-like [Mizuhopecten yessoensis]
MANLCSTYGIVVLLCVSFWNLDSVLSATSTNFKEFLDNEPFRSFSDKIFPKIFQIEHLDVDIEFTLVGVTDFDELNGNLAIVGLAVIRWRNELLTWNLVDDNPIESLLLPQSSFWRPPVTLTNSVDSLAELGDSTYKIRIDYEGNALWNVGIVAKTSCTVDVTLYPFDRQSCNVTFAPLGYLKDQIVVNSSNPIDLSLYMENVEWTLESTSVMSTIIADVSYVIFTLDLARKPGYFLVNMIIPILIIGLLNGLVFLLPADCGERVGYAITAFLTFAVFLTMVAENLPKASEPMSLLCYFLTLMLMVSSLITIVTILILRVYHQDEETTPPEAVRHMVAFMTCRKCKKWCSKKKTSRNAVADIIDNDDDDDNSDAEVDSIQAPVDDRDIKGITWRMVGGALDGFCFIFFFFFSLGITIFFMYPLVNAGLEG